MQLTARDLMTPAPAVVRASQTLEEALEALLTECVSELPVINEAWQLLGILPDFEVLKAQMLQLPPDTPIESLMSRQVTTIDSDVPLERIAALFRDGRHQRLAVIERGRLAGMVARRDAIRMLHALQAIDQCRRPVEREATTEAANALRGPRFVQHLRQLHAAAATDEPPCRA